MSASPGSARCSSQLLLGVSCGGNGAQATGNIHQAQITALCVSACLGVLVYKHLMCAYSVYVYYVYMIYNKMHL